MWQVPDLSTSQFVPHRFAPQRYATLRSTPQRNAIFSESRLGTAAHHGASRHHTTQRNGYLMTSDPAPYQRRQRTVSWAVVALAMIAAASSIFALLLTLIREAPAR